MITLDNLTKSLGTKLLFYNVSLCLTKNHRYGIVGANGSGKSTLLKVLSGEEEPTEGEVHRQKGVTIGFLKQDHYSHENDRIIDVVLKGHPILWKAIQEKENLLSKEHWTDAEIQKLDELEEIFTLYQGYEAEHQTRKLLLGLGIREDQLETPMGELSGGYKLRVLLASVLFKKPDILLLDEPTNYLDIVSIAWLENYLKNDFEGLLLFVSHDRSFLNTLSTHVLDIDYGDILSYTGNFDAFIKEKKATQERRLKEKKDLEKKIAQMKVFIEKFRYKPSKSKQALSREKSLEKMEVPEILQSSRKTPHFAFTQRRPSGKTVLEVKDLSKKYGTHTLFQALNFSLYRGDKVAIIGPNGIGKSSLLKTLLNYVNPNTGSFSWGYETHLSYLPQEAQVDSANGLMDWLSHNHGQTYSSSVRNVLGKMLFSGDDAHKSISSLSGGETVRLLFADIMLKKDNVLILDEPTNHLDLEAAETLGKALHDYEGSILLVSHDRHLIKHVANRILAITFDGLIDFHGTYEEFIQKHELATS